MELDIITRQDLDKHKEEMLSEIKKLLSGQENISRPWLRSADVRRQLRISPGTLQNMRISGLLSFTKIGGIFYYKDQDIQKLMKGDTRI